MADEGAPGAGSLSDIVVTELQGEKALDEYCASCKAGVSIFALPNSTRRGRHPQGPKFTPKPVAGDRTCTSLLLRGEAPPKPQWARRSVAKWSDEPVSTAKLAPDKPHRARKSVARWSDDPMSTANLGGSERKRKKLGSR